MSLLTRGAAGEGAADGAGEGCELSNTSLSSPPLGAAAATAVTALPASPAGIHTGLSKQCVSSSFTFIKTKLVNKKTDSFYHCNTLTKINNKSNIPDIF